MPTYLTFFKNISDQNSKISWQVPGGKSILKFWCQYKVTIAVFSRYPSAVKVTPVDQSSISVLPVECSF